MDHTPECPDDVELALWLDGGVSPVRGEALARHVDSCPECRFVVAQAEEDPHELYLLAGSPARRGFLIDAFEEEITRPRLAADTADDTRTSEIPSVPADVGRSILHFRVEPEGGGVTAYLVCQDTPDREFRVVRLSDRVYLTDRSGAVQLEGLGATDLFGSWVEVPPILAEFRLTVSALNAIDLTSLPAPVRSTGMEVVGSFAWSPKTCRLELRVRSPKTCDVVVVWDEQVATCGVVRPFSPLSMRSPVVSSQSVRILIVG